MNIRFGSRKIDARCMACTAVLLAISGGMLRAQPAGVITTVAGNGIAGFSGDGGSAVQAELGARSGGPLGVAADSQGNIYIADNGNGRVRKVDTKGIITTVAGGAIGAVGDGGPAIKATVAVSSVVVDSAGNLIIAGGTQIRKVDTQGIITTLAGGPLNSFTYSGDGGSALQAGFFAEDAAVDAAGNIYISDSTNNRIRKVDTAGIITTYAGTGVPGFSGDNGPAIKAKLALPQGLSVDTAGNVYFADGTNARIRKVDKNGIITTVAGNGTPLSLPFQDGGPATSAGMVPLWVTVDNAGNLFIADNGGNKIRKVDTSGIITTVAGMGGIALFSGDGGPATKAGLASPVCVAVDIAGNLYIAESRDERIRKVSSGLTLPLSGPSFSANGVVNGASFVSGGIVPGELATIFGSNLTTSNGINLASTLPLPTEFLKVSLKVDGTPAALFAVDNVNGQQQINFQVPWEVAGKPAASIEITDGGATSPPVAVPVLAAQPAIFSYTSGGKVFGAILHANFQLADSAHPAKPGETVLIYCTGLGEVVSPPADGAPGNGQATIAKPVVAIGGNPAAVSFSGLAPGFVGLYQVNAEIPAVVASGNASVSMVIAGAGKSSNSVLLPIQ